MLDFETKGSVDVHMNSMSIVLSLSPVVSNTFLNAGSHVPHVVKDDLELVILLLGL